MGTKPDDWRRVADWPIEPLGGQIGFGGERIDLWRADRPASGRFSSDSGKARFCASVDDSSSTARCVRMPNASSHDEPVVAFGDVGGRAAEHAHDAGVRQQRAVHQIHEHFGGGAIEPRDGHALAVLDGEIGDAQRTQPAVVLDDAGELERAHQRRSTTGWPSGIRPLSRTNASGGVPTSPTR